MTRRSQSMRSDDQVSIFPEGNSRAEAQSQNPGRDCGISIRENRPRARFGGENRLVLNGERGGEIAGQKGVKI